MNHFFNTIQGWFNFANIYKEIVEQSADNSKFVEIGSWKGKSSTFLAVEIVNSKKNIALYCVDTWKGSEEHSEELSVINDTLFEEFLSNIEPVKHIITPIRETSLQAASMFEDNSLDFVYIDASHDYENVKADIHAWYPKVKVGGLFAGHDFHWDGVKRAVKQFSKRNQLNVDIIRSTWKIIKP